MVDQYSVGSTHNFGGIFTFVGPLAPIVSSDGHNDLLPPLSDRWQAHLEQLARTPPNSQNREYPSQDRIEEARSERIFKRTRILAQDLPKFNH